jgi:hypothetical protein
MQNQSQTTMEERHTYMSLTDGDMSFAEYLTCCDIHVKQSVNPSPPKHLQCIKCSYTNKFSIRHCII